LEGPTNQVEVSEGTYYLGKVGFAMEEPSLQDSREDLFYTTTADFLEYTPYEAGKRVKTSVFDKFFETTYSIFLGTRSILIIAVLSSSKTLFDSLKFSYVYFLYINTKIVDFFNLLETTKDFAVRTLMWRRGLLFRPATHGGVFALVIVAVVAGGLFSRSDIAAQDLTLAESALTLDNSTETVIPTDRPRSETISYKVLKGETMSEIAESFAVSVDSIKWANDLSDEDRVKPGDTLKIPPVSGVVHNVKKGETIYSLAKKYKANPQAIADFPFNYIDQSLAVSIGQSLVIPGGSKPDPLVVPTPEYTPAPGNNPINYAAVGSGLFARPVAGSINQYPSWYHPGVDFGASYGTPVYAAGAGRVITASSYGSGFGMHIFVDHGNGYITAYAHLSGIKVNVGQNVSKGQLIGAVGCSGFCTGPHLHFEVRRSGSKINPLSVL